MTTADGEGGRFRVAADAATILRRIARVALAYEVAWKAATALLLGPMATALLNAAIAVGWDPAVTNEALIGFGLSPLGLATLGAFGTLALAVAYFEQAGLLILALAAARGRPVTLVGAVRAAVRDLPGLVGIAAREVAIASVCLAPFAGAAALTYAMLLSGTDINYYLAARPPRFLLAAAIVGAIGLGAAAVLATLYVRWVFAVPACLLDGRPPGAALRASAAMVRGRGWRVFGAVVAWQVGKAAAFAGLALALDFVGGAAVDALGTTRPTVVLGGVAFLMLADGAVLALASMAEGIGFALMVTIFYEGTLRVRGEPQAPPPRPPRSWRRRAALVGAIVAAVALATAAQAGLVVRTFTRRRPVAISAHRAGPRPAPENTLAALEAGIAAGADYAEIDVQKTADGVIVVIHDEDLRRVAGVARTVRSLTLAEIGAIPLLPLEGSPFAGERIPTLDAFIAAARGRIRLNIELKYYVSDPTLARDVVALLQRRGFAREAVISSLESAALAEVRRLAPEIPVGPIVSAQIGDLTRLDVDFLSLRRGLISPALVARAHGRGIAVHAWTIDDRAGAVSMIDRGVDNLITDDPAAIRRALDWQRSLGDPELVLLRFRDWLGSSTFRRLVREPGPAPTPAP